MITTNEFLWFFIPVFLVGYVGVIYVFIRAKIPFDWRCHLYSTIPLIISVVAFILFTMYQKFGFAI